VNRDIGKAAYSIAAALAGTGVKKAVNREQKDPGKDERRTNKEKKVMCMEIALINRQDVAEPDQTASGVAGTGQNNGKKTGIVEYGMIKDAGKKNRIVLGMGVLYNGGTTPVAPGAIPVSCPGISVLQNSTTAPEDHSTEPCERSGDLLFSCYERQERIYNRLNQKITRLDKKLNKLEGRRMHKRDEKRKSE
jgi:hypothetical protein